MTMNELLASQQVVVAGLGLTGQSVVRFLSATGASVKVWDTRANATVPESITQPVTLGELPPGYWEGVDTLVLSPGISPSHASVKSAKLAGVEVIGDVELFARLQRTPAFGITGSNGKTTVTLLLTHILNKAGLKACAAGNVGRPVLETVGEEWDFLVLELSSFQLETTSSLNLLGATILNVTDDHLDRHGTMADYAAAKQRIFAHCEHAVVWQDHDETYPAKPVANQTAFKAEPSAKDFGFTDNQITWQGNPVLDMASVKLVGSHNVLNIQAALSLALIAGLKIDTACEAVKSFEPAPHRCVEIANTNGIRWIDDSKATNVGATLAALEGLGSSKTGKLILIAGGDGKGADLTALKAPFTRYVDLVIAIGKDGKAISDLVPGSQFLPDLPSAVQLAAQQAEPGDMVLLSPACASIEMFDNYAHRAKVFADAITEVTAR